ncbi:MAG: cysteine methyltransferase [Candidatus Marinimicrobia bacterium]|nr:cysteine methyltransferase [Candidatus Neomarinimicrobiota bacterium]|tara:strand:+ start:87 stop:572 length:486 start_codon:yes stop_codon:yes gene_type:complete
MNQFATLETVMGTFGIRANSIGIFRIHLPNDSQNKKKKTPVSKQSDQLKHAVQQLKHYFNNERKSFDVNLDLNLPPFYKKILIEVSKIPFGTTVSYSDLAAKAGKPKAARAAGTANAINPVPIIIPCHRVIKSNGKLGNYGGGLDLKRKLLIHESLKIKSY